MKVRFDAHRNCDMKATYEEDKVAMDGKRRLDKEMSLRV